MLPTGAFLRIDSIILRPGGSGKKIGRSSEGSVSKTELHPLGVINMGRLMYVPPALLLDSFPIHGWPATHGDKSAAPAPRNAYTCSVLLKSNHESRSRFSRRSPVRRNRSSRAVD